MTQAVLTITGKVVPPCTCAPLTTAKLYSNAEKSKHKTFNETIERLLGYSMSIPTKQSAPDFDLHDLTCENDADKPLDLIEADALLVDGKTAFKKPFLTT